MTPALRLARISTLALALVACLFAPGGLFLCLGLDGHVAVEMSSGGCAPEAVPSAGVGSAVCSEDSCGSCLDVALGIPAPPRVVIAADHDFSMQPVALPARLAGRIDGASIHIPRLVHSQLGCAPGASRAPLLRC